ncbi:capping protein-inhibiting regulator of actin dynamics isoform X2 [Corythoichthys intestinalis]|uniref:capping protein-inhibiting regulator of actin dynamics isoform X2 n=1 Tax=Corythoichthys intestinalis TaxID=161448 RepID=UPI0025A62BE6|nr:capping protein-inhibiting regulator of actin dynamics isoform X2 [Corythoichthys intestinalis]XP_061793201.1 capping protein-inhibiting regulator of actin dynamics [Nerophis lumbriciformis]
MSWFHSLRDDFTLRPFEIQETPSDPAAMASGPPDVMANQEPAEVSEECSGKKKSKFQTFKNFFARKKKKESTGDRAELKGSQSSDNISKTSQNNTLSRSEKEKGSKISLGSKALSHDSVFVSDSSEANEALGASQDSIHGKVKSLQLQLKQAIRLGSPPSLMCVKRSEDAGTMSEDDGLPCSPPEYISPHVAKNQAQRNSSISLEGVDSDDDKLSCAASSRVVSPLVTVPGDFSQPASPFGCLDNSAAKHKLGLRQKANNKRKPANRLEIKSEEHNEINGSLNIPFPERQEEEKIIDASGDESKQKFKEAEECQENKQPLLQEAKEKTELEKEQDISIAQDTSCQSDFLAADTQPSPSPQLSTRSSYLDTPRTTPEPPAGEKDFPDHSIVNGNEGNMEGPDLVEDDVLGGVVADSSFLQEVLSSLKTSCTQCVDSEDVVLEMKDQTKDENKETEDEDEPVFDLVAPCDAVLMDQSSEDEKEEITALSSPSPHVDEVEKSEDENEKEEEEVEEEELVVERFGQPCIPSEDMADINVPQEAKPEEQNDSHITESNHSEEQETEASDEEVEEESHVVMVEEEVEENQKLEEETDEEWEILPDETSEEICSVTFMQEERESVIVDATNNTQYTHDVETHQESCDQDSRNESLASPNENDSECKAREEGVDDDEDFKHTEVHSEPQEEANLEDENVEQEELLEMEKDQISPIPSSSSPLIESPLQEHTVTPTPSEITTLHETTFASEYNTPREITPPPETNTRTTVVHMNLVSPTSESVTFSFQPSPTDECTKVSSSEQRADEETFETVSEVEEQMAHICAPAAVTEDAMPPSSDNQIVKQSLEGSNESKVRFTIAPAWQRSLSDEEAKQTSSAPLPGADPVAEDMEETTKKDLPSDAQMEKFVKTTVVRGTATKAAVVHESVKAQTSTVPSKEESSAAMEGSYDTPFGVRLRKTAVLPRFSSEEENTEEPTEPPVQPVSCKVEASSFKPAISQAVLTKPALPKKPDVHGDTVVKSKRVSEPAPSRGVSAESQGPSWISMARQKQKIYKENSLEEMTVKKEEQDRKSSLPAYVSSTSKKEHPTKAPEFTGKVSLPEKPSSTPENETRKSVSPVTPVPPQLPKSVNPKPAHPLISSKSAPSHRSLPPPTPVPVAIKPQSILNPSKPPLESKPQTQSMILTSPPFSARINPPLPTARVVSLSGPPPVSPRGLAPSSLPQDEPPWMALAKKKAKAWSEMPQIVQ